MIPCALKDYADDVVICRHLGPKLNTVEPHLFEPRFNQTPRLYELFVNSPKICVFS